MCRILSHVEIEQIVMPTMRGQVSSVSAWVTEAIPAVLVAQCEQCMKCREYACESSKGGTGVEDHEPGS